MNKNQLATTHTSLELSKQLKEWGCELKSGSCWVNYKEGGWNILRNGAPLGQPLKDKQTFFAYDILNDLCIRYAKEMFGKENKILVETKEVKINLPANECIPSQIIPLLQQNKKQEAEDYLWENCLFNPKNK